MYHAQSQQYASLAEAARREQKTERAREFYRLAAEHETLALREVGPDKARTFGITSVSAASLWFKAHQFGQAQILAHEALTAPSLPEFAREQLQYILQVIWAEEARTQAGIDFAKGEVLVSVSGGEVVSGGAPLELILRKVDEVSRIFYRVIEMLLEQPFRRRGAPSSEIQEQFRPWLLQVPAGSYQFAVRVERPKQPYLFPEFAPSVDRITESFLDVVRASADDPEGKLLELVPQEDYRDAFLKLTRNLAPTGKVFGKLEMRTSEEDLYQPVVLIPANRETINHAVKRADLDHRKSEGQEEVQLHGVLRGLQLDHDWLEVVLVDEEPKTVRVYGAGDVVDDVVGPMVNHRVIVNAILKPKGRYEYRDIEREE
jgi:hypothetical protein